MDEVFSLIFQGIVGAVDGLKALTFTAYGYTISLYDWYLALFVLSALFPIVFVSTRYGVQSVVSERTNSPISEEPSEPDIESIVRRADKLHHS